MPAVPGLQVQRGGRQYRRFFRKQQALWRSPLVKTSPALELSGYGTFTGVDPSSFINSVTITIGQFQSGPLMGPPVIELWDFSGSGVIIGSGLGTATTVSTNIDTLVFPNVTFAQLATLRVRVYAYQHAAAPGVIQNVNYAGLTVSYSPVLGQAALATGAGTAKNATVAAVDGRNPGRASPVQGVPAPAAYATFT